MQGEDRPEVLAGYLFEAMRNHKRQNQQIPPGWIHSLGEEDERILLLALRPEVAAEYGHMKVAREQYEANRGR